MIAVRKGDGGAPVWDLSSTWTLDRRLVGSADGASPIADRVTSLDFSPDQKLLASGGGVPSRSGEVKLWELGAGKLLRSFDDVHVDTVTSVRFSPDGKRLASGSTDRFVRIIDLATGKVSLSLEGHQHHVLGIAWKRDGHTIASAGADNTLRFWNADTGERKGIVNSFDKEVTSVSFIGDTDLALVTSGDGKAATFHDSGEEERSFTGGADFVYAAAASPDGQAVIAGGQDGILRVWDTNTGKPVAFSSPKLIESTRSPNGR
jgi:WD40 repeat protein